MLKQDKWIHKKVKHLNQCIGSNKYFLNTQNKNSFQSFSQRKKIMSYHLFEICSGKLCLPLGGQKGWIPKLSLYRKKRKRCDNLVE